jgi:hypothetical protein
MLVPCCIQIEAKHCRIGGITEAKEAHQLKINHYANISCSRTSLTFIESYLKEHQSQGQQATQHIYQFIAKGTFPDVSWIWR